MTVPCDQYCFPCPQSLSYLFEALSCLVANVRRASGGQGHNVQGYKCRPRKSILPRQPVTSHSSQTREVPKNV